jgi:hypothetical protein
MSECQTHATPPRWTDSVSRRARRGRTAGLSFFFDRRIIDPMIAPAPPPLYVAFMKKIATIASIVAALAFVVSCATTQKAPPPETAPAPAAQPAAQPAAVPDPEAELTKAKALQKRIDDYSLSGYDADDYAAGTKALAAGQETYGKDNASAKQSLQGAITAFNAVLAKGIPLILADAQAKTDASKKAADDLKASVAVKDDYAAAEATYRKALQEKDGGDLENASKDLADAKTAFDAVAATAGQKKEAATQALQSARQGVTQSQQKAADAQQTITADGITAPASAQ